MARRIGLDGRRLVLVALPPRAAVALGQPFYIDLVRRIMILAIAAVSLNLILGYGGMVSLRPRRVPRDRRLRVGILGFYGFGNGWLQWPLAVGASALVALAIGAVSIRTSGIYFIMITLAFTQMLYYLGISLAEFGGDDGMRLKRAQPARRRRPGRPACSSITWRWSCCSPSAIARSPDREFALRHGAARGEVERAAHRARSASRPIRYRLVAFVHRRRDVRPRRRALRQPHELHHARA